MKVLIVEDNDLNRDMLTRRLESRGYDVVTAVDGENGVEMAQTASPNVILMDLTLPSIDGCEATRRIKRTDATRQIPVIALTGHADGEHRDLATEAGCSSFIQKPIDFHALLEVINRLCTAGACAS